MGRSGYVWCFNKYHVFIGGFVGGFVGLLSGIGLISQEDRRRKEKTRTESFKRRVETGNFKWIETTRKKLKTALKF